MSSPFSLHARIEAALANRSPSALTPAPTIIRPVVSTGIESVDELLEGGLPLGAITEMVGPQCSGRTTLALSFVARLTQGGRICAWIDVSDALDPESAAAVGVDLSRLLWVRCGVTPSIVQQFSPGSFALPEKYLIPLPIKKGLHGGGFGPHPRDEVKGLPDAVSGLLRPEIMAPRCVEPQRKMRPERQVCEPNLLVKRPTLSGKPWSRIDQALRATDLLLQGGGFSSIVLDMGSIAPDYASRVPLNTWFRYRAAAERTQASVLLLTQYTCAKSSAGIVLRLQSGNALQNEMTVFAGIKYRVELARQRFTQACTNVVPLRKPPQRERTASWQSRTTWAGRP